MYRPRELCQLVDDVTPGERYLHGFVSESLVPEDDVVADVRTGTGTVQECHAATSHMVEPQ